MFVTLRDRVLAAPSVELSFARVLLLVVAFEELLRDLVLLLVVAFEELLRDLVLLLTAGCSDSLLSRVFGATVGVLVVRDLVGAWVAVVLPRERDVP